MRWCWQRMSKTRTQCEELKWKDFCLHGGSTCTTFVWPLFLLFYRVFARTSCSVPARVTDCLLFSDCA